MTVLEMSKKNGSPMLERIDDPVLRERASVAQAYLHQKYTELGTWKKVARLIGGYSEASLTGFASGSYPGSPSNLVAAIERAALLEKDRSTSVFTATFVETSIAHRVRRAVRQTRMRSSLGICAGESGVGKTQTLTKIAAEDSSILYLRANPTMGGRLWSVLVWLLDGIGQEFMVKSSSPSTCYQELVRALTRSRKMLVLDESQFLSRQALDILRTLSEDADTPILFAGNESLHEFGFFAAANAAAFTQFVSRCSVQDTLRRREIKRGDVKLIASQLLEDDVLEDTVNELLGEAQAPGGFRRLHSILQRAHERARGSKPSAEQVLAAIAETQKVRGAL